MEFIERIMELWNLLKELWNSLKELWNYGIHWKNYGIMKCKRIIEFIDKKKRNKENLYLLALIHSGMDFTKLKQYYLSRWL